MTAPKAAAQAKAAVQAKAAPAPLPPRPVPSPPVAAIPLARRAIQRSQVAEISDKGGYKGNDCGFSSAFTGAFRKKGAYYEGRSIKKGTKLYHGTDGKTKWWEEEPPRSGRSGPFFSTSLAHSKTLAGANGVLLEYTVRQDFPLAFTGGRGGFEVMEEMLGKEMGYYSTKECELSVRNNRVADLVDWQSVRVVGPGFWSTAGSYLWWGISGIGKGIGYAFSSCYRGCKSCASKTKSCCTSSSCCSSSTQTPLPLYAPVASRPELAFD